MIIVIINNNNNNSNSSNNNSNNVYILSTNMMEGILPIKRKTVYPKKKEALNE